MFRIARCYTCQMFTDVRNTDTIVAVNLTPNVNPYDNAVKNAMGLFVRKFVAGERVVVCYSGTRPRILSKEMGTWDSPPLDIETSKGTVPPRWHLQRGKEQHLLRA